MIPAPLVAAGLPAAPLLILGLDPGSRHTGYGLVECRRERPQPIACGRFSPPAHLSLPLRLAALSRDVEALLDRHRPSAVAIEKPFHGINARSAIVLAEARGALLAVLGRAAVAVHEYAPAQVKAALGAGGRASKEEVARLVGLLLGLDLRQVPPDASDALAVALCYASRQRIEQFSALSRRLVLPRLATGA